MQAFLKTSTVDANFNNINKKYPQEPIQILDFINDGVLYDRKNKDSSRPSIQEFFHGRDVFVTGGSGFMGKVLIEKLLRSCPGINKIFMLMRSKKGKTIHERIEDLHNSPLYEPLRTLTPDALTKMMPIEGDVCQLKMGINDSDFMMLKNVSVIFHAAASVRFDDPLNYAIILNTRGTREVIHFAETLKNLKVMLYVSTTYCNLKSTTVKEEIYSSLADWKKSIEIAETIDRDILDVLSPKYTNYMPNTYTFSKHLSEQIINDYRSSIPLVLFRPSIVISTMKDPFPGWIDNFNGPGGLILSCGVGITRTMYCDPDNIADFTPVDVSIKAMITAAWKRGIDCELKQLPVYNCSTSTIRHLTMGGIISKAKEINEIIPVEKMIWAPGGTIACSRITNFIKTVLFHIFPAILLDIGLKLTGREPFVLGLQRKVSIANSALEYFILNRWTFENFHFLSLDNEIKEEDTRDFHYTDFVQFDMMLYFKNCLLGGKRYLLGEKDENIPWAKRNLKKMQRIDFTVKFIVYAILFYIFIIRMDIINKIYNFLIGVFL